MFDQSFSVKNFRKIYDLDLDNKGVIENTYFADAYKHRTRIIFLKKYIIALLKKYKSGVIQEDLYQQRKDKFNKHIHLRNELYNNCINNKLESIVRNVNKKGYTLPVTENALRIKDKKIFTIGNDIEAFFVSKHIQYVLKHLFDIKFTQRDLIISRLNNLIQDASPKYIIKADIEHFYESINHKNLLKIIHSSPELSVTPKRIITQLVRKYSEITGKSEGLPRGIGISAYLSEIYMLDIDTNIRSNPDVSYYERYVDDLIIIFSPTSLDKTTEYLQSIKFIIEQKELSLNDKTKEIDLYQHDNGSFDYLGYNFNILKNKCDIKISTPRIDKIKHRIEKSFDCYHKSLTKTPKRAYKELLLRIRFLTSNTRLYNSKSKAFIGIYFSNKFINSDTDLSGLDGFLKYKNNTIQDKRLKKIIGKLSFKDGFNLKIFRTFSIAELSIISKGWKYV